MREPVGLEDEAGVGGEEAEWDLPRAAHRQWELGP